MKRRELLAGFPLLALLTSCGEDTGQYWDFEVNFTGRVTVIGAGAAGLAAGYILNRYGVDFEILEASSVFGGRVKRADDFADFPIDLGAEWIHEDPSVLAALIDDPSVNSSIDVLPYSPETVSAYEKGKLRDYNAGGNYYSEFKFRQTTWYGFLERHIAPGLLDRIRFDRPVTEIDSSGEQIRLLDAVGDTYGADRVLVTAPVKLLQGGSLRFVPELSAERLRALEQVSVPDGIKAFFEFSQRFYPDILFMTSPLDPDATGQLYYDAAFRKATRRNILGLFCVGAQATQYTDLPNDVAIRDYILAELDAIFDGQASAAYVKHVVQNWSKEPYIRGAYSTEFLGSEAEIIAALAQPHDRRVFFAGEALSTDNGATVPGAMQSAYAAVKTILKNAD